LALTLAACGGSSTSTETSEAASAAPVTEAASESAEPSAAASPSLQPSDLRIALFSAATNNEYLQAGIAGAQEAAEAAGAQIDVFDGKFDPQEQFNQLQQALTSGKYNAFVVEPNDGNLVCDFLTNDAAEAGVLVSVFNQPICDRATKPGDEVHQPGTITFVGGQTLDVYQAWIEEIISNNPDGAKVAVISGPDLNANTINLNTALETLAATPGFEIVANQKTDYSTPKAFEAAQAIMQANPDLDVIISNYSGMTQGVLQAADAAGKVGEIKIYDMGGNTWAVDAVKNGQIAQTVMFLPKQEGYDAVQAVVDFVNGMEVDPFINLTESSALPGTPYVTQENAADFTPEY
jgi:ribose transport system substrate-binding protein